MFYIGTDLGGTGIKAAIVDEDGRILSKKSCPTNAQKGYESVLKSMAKLAFELADEQNVSMDAIAAIGIGCPGTVDAKRGVVGFSNNLNWRDVPVKKIMESLTGRKVYIENDANAAAYGEYINGSLKNSSNGILITLGTGVGAGIVLDGKIFTGSNGLGAEIGHSVIAMDGRPCSCGRRGCFEAYASATALVDFTKNKMERDKESAMWQICQGKIENVNGETVFAAAKLGDKSAAEVIEEYIKGLACGIINVVNVFQPEIICLGGGVSGSADVLIPGIKEIFNREVYSRHEEKQAEIKKAALGNDAGIIGAAFLWKNNSASAEEVVK